MVVVQVSKRCNMVCHTVKVTRSTHGPHGQPCVNNILEFGFDLFIW